MTPRDFTHFEEHWKTSSYNLTAVVESNLVEARMSKKKTTEKESCLQSDFTCAMEKTSTIQNATTELLDQRDRISERQSKRRQRKPQISGQQRRGTRKQQQKIQPQALSQKQLRIQHPQRQRQLQKKQPEQQRKMEKVDEEEGQLEKQQYDSAIARDVVASTSAPDRFFLRFEGITAIVHKEMLPLIDHFMTIVLELKEEVDKVKRNRDVAYAENRNLQAQLLMGHQKQAPKCTKSQQSQTQLFTQEQHTQTQQHTQDKEIQTQQYILRPKQNKPYTLLQPSLTGKHTQLQQNEQQRQRPMQQTQPQQIPAEQRQPQQISTEQILPNQTQQKEQIQQCQSQPKHQYTPQKDTRYLKQQQQQDKRKYYNKGRQKQRWKHKKHNNHVENEILAALRKVGQMVAMSPATLQVPGPPEVMATSSAAAVAAQPFSPASGLLPISWSIGAQQQFGASAVIPMPTFPISNGLQTCPPWQIPYF